MTNVPSKRWSKGQSRTKPIIMDNYYVALNYTEPLEHDNNHIMVKIQLHGTRESVTINTMIDTGATEDLIDREVCNEHRIKMIKAKYPREIYLTERKTKRYGPCYPYNKMSQTVTKQGRLSHD